MMILPSKDQAEQSIRMSTVLVVGNMTSPEMQPLVSWLSDQILNVSRNLVVSTLADWFGRTDSEFFPDLVIVLQSWSAEFPQAEIRSLLESAPLARIVVCYGAWCESDGRNCDIWPLSVRVPLWSARSRIEREWDLIHAKTSVAPIPLSASRDEVFAADHIEYRPATLRRKILVDTPDQDFAEFLLELVNSSGHTIVAESPEVILFDLDPWGTQRSEKLAELQTRHPQSRVLGMTSEPSLTNQRKDELGKFEKILPKLRLRLSEIRLVE